MADPVSRKNVATARLRTKFLKTQESLASQFEFKMYVIIKFKAETKKCAVFEVAEVHPVMTNDYESVLKEQVSNAEFTAESATELLWQDIVQLHAREWCNKRPDVISGRAAIDFLLWPRRDIATIECKLFSRWVGDKNSPFLQLKKSFLLRSDDYTQQVDYYNQTGQSSALVLTNPEQSAFLFLARHQLDPSRGLSTIYTMKSLCIYIPQNDLMNWCPATLESVMRPYLEAL